MEPISVLQATIEGLQVLPLKDVVSKVDIFVITTGNKDIIMHGLWHKKGEQCSSLVFFSCVRKTISSIF